MEMFKGFNEESGKWVQGNEIKKYSNGSGFNRTYIKEVAGWLAVHPNSVSKFTNHYGENDCLLYEGDIIESLHGDVGQIIWDKTKSAYYFKSGSNMYERLLDYNLKHFRVVNHVFNYSVW